VTQQESTVANADLWSRYFQNEWSQWMSPWASPEVAASTAARVAGFLTFIAAGPIAWLYSANVPNVTHIEDYRASVPVSAAGSELESIEEAA
jgi:hypothetical protein